MKTTTLLPILLFTLVSMPQRASAQDPDDPDSAEAPAAAPAWSGSAGLSYLATGGNSDTETAGLDVEAKRRPMPWGLELAAQIHRAEEDGETTAERYHAGLRGTRALSERWEAFAGLSAEQDEFAGIDLRGIVEAGAVYKALTGPRHTLGLDLGVTWTDEDRLAPEIDDSWLGGLLAASYELEISESATFSQALKYHADFDDTDNWRVDSLTALTAAINKRLALRLSHEIRYRNEPVGDNDDTDTATKASVVWSIGA